MPEELDKKPEKQALDDAAKPSVTNRMWSNAGAPPAKQQSAAAPSTAQACPGCGHTPHRDGEFCPKCGFFGS